MPIYEYACKGCGRVFEEIVLRRADEDEVTCPGCRGRRVAKVMSRPAAPAPGGGDAGRPGPGCGPVG